MHLINTRHVAPFFRRRTWTATQRSELRLTFDDGPHPATTLAILDSLDRLDSKATFFCLGRQIVAYPDLYRAILDRGHQVGNHTHHHLDGWRTSCADYISDVQRCAVVCDSTLFRPPYGRLRRSQQDALIELGYEIVMWSVMPGDWLPHLTVETIADRCVRHADTTSCIVLHDRGDMRIVDIIERILRGADSSSEGH